MTYCLELLNLIVKNCDKDFKLIKASYNADGLTAIIQDTYDNQYYDLNIEPRKEVKDGYDNKSM